VYEVQKITCTTEKRRSIWYRPKRILGRQIPAYSTSHHVYRNVIDCGFGCGAPRVEFEAHHKLSYSIELSQALNPAIPLESLSPSISKTATLLETLSQNNGYSSFHPIHIHLSTPPHQRQQPSQSRKISVLPVSNKPQIRIVKKFVALRDCARNAKFPDRNPVVCELIRR
jgi:hypothetical protein